MKFFMFVLVLVLIVLCHYHVDMKHDTITQTHNPQLSNLQCFRWIILITMFCAELVEHTCGMANLHMGEFFSNISNGVDTYSIREPLGICAGICSFNFPAMIPLLVCFVSLCFFFFHYILFLMHMHQNHQIECLIFLFTSTSLSWK